MPVTTHVTNVHASRQAPRPSRTWRKLLHRGITSAVHTLSSAAAPMARPGRRNRAVAASATVEAFRKTRSQLQPSVQAVDSCAGMPGGEGRGGEGQRAGDCVTAGRRAGRWASTQQHAYGGLYQPGPEETGAAEAAAYSSPPGGEVELGGRPAPLLSLEHNAPPQLNNCCTAYVASLV